MTDPLDSERGKLPLFFAVGIALYGASRFDVTRPVAGVLLTYGFPVAAVLMGFFPISDSRSRSLAIGAGVGAVGGTEIAIGHAMAPNIEALAAIPDVVIQVALGASLLGAVTAQALAATSGFRNFFGAWVGMVCMLGAYLPAHVKVGRDSLDSFVAALLVSLFIGGGVGLFGGTFATSLSKRRSVDAKQPSKQSQKKKKADDR